MICLVAANQFDAHRTPTYEAKTQLFVSIGGTPENLDQTQQGGLFSVERAKSYAEVASSPALAEAVIKRLHLHESTRDLQANVRVSVPLDTVVINVTVTDSSQAQAKAIADAVGVEFPGFVNRLEAPQEQHASPVSVAIASPAQLPTQPISPKKSLDLVLAGILGVVLGLGAAVLREALRDPDRPSRTARRRRRRRERRTRTPTDDGGPRD